MIGLRKLSLIQNTQQSELWNPAQINSLAWFDASDLASITFNGSNVSQWNDKSGNLRHATQSVVNDQPNTDILNGLNVIRFQANLLTFPAINVKSAVFVHDKANGSSFANICMVYGSDLSGNDHTFLRTNATDYSISIDGSNYNSGTVTVNGGNNSSGGNINLGLTNNQKNSPLIWTVQHTNVVGTNLLARSIAGTNVFTSFINIAEIIFFDYILDTQTRDILVGYLAHKWSLVDNLPLNHLFKNNPPLQN